MSMQQEARLNRSRERPDELRRRSTGMSTALRANDREGSWQRSTTAALRAPKIEYEVRDEDGDDPAGYQRIYDC